MHTDEYRNGFESMALHFNMTERKMGNGKSFYFGTKSSDGWITQIQPSTGLFVSSMWFTPTKALTYTMNIDRPCFLIWCVDCGDVTFTQKGVKAYHLSPINHIITNPLKPYKITFPAHIHTCCTCILVFEEYLYRLLNTHITDCEDFIGKLKSHSNYICNTPDITLVLEQTKWAARNGILPLFNYECKIGELFTILYKNLQFISTIHFNRRYHITWENEQKLWNIKAILDKDILQTPTVESLALSEAFSVSKLHRCFKQYFGMTINHYIRVEKMKRALLMLASDEFSIKNIAHMCGYDSPSKFTESFKEIHHITPSQYRKAHYL
ncbi:helix-turn-helix transcriptional regulator [Lachnotalea glycerini]|uniref:AraC family transcriptional regulator n=1 Tax=Lachnotalea glycerini TaxID=1763509 RepID=A0A371JFY2_9FIRM|nr:AraC family transcriptional regulator [Lachnotalea glycerini]RDY31633.1 AraC family transcriptional regulator [Lachnotalea glycerini]